MTATTLIGTIENVKFTSGSFGEQFVTINGIEYMCYWEIHQLKVGSTVEIRISEPRDNCYIGNSKVIFSQPQAEYIRSVA